MLYRQENSSKGNYIHTKTKSLPRSDGLFLMNIINLTVSDLRNLMRKITLDTSMLKVFFVPAARK